MFPTPAERYYQYVTRCVQLGNPVLTKEDYFRELAKIPEHRPIAWVQANA